MEMRIRKQTIFGILGLISIVTGIFLLTVLVEELQRYGLWGYSFLGIFIVSLLLYINYERNRYKEYRIADKAVRQTAEEYRNKLSPTELNKAESELRERLIKKIDNETFTFLK